MRRILTRLSAIVLCFGSSAWCGAAEPAAATGYIPSDASVVVVARVKKILDSKLLEPIFKEAAVADAIKRSDPGFQKIDELIVVGSRWTQEPTIADMPICPAIVVRFREPVNGKDFFGVIQQRFRKNAEERSHQGKTYWFSAPDMFAFQADEKTVAIAGQEETLKEIIAGATGKGPIAEKLRAAGTSDDAVVVVLTEPLREVIAKARANVPADAAADVPIVKELLALPEQLKSVVLTLNLSDETLLKAVLDCTGAESGKKVSATLQKALDTAQLFAGTVAIAARSSSDTPQAAKDAMDVGLRLLDGIKLASSGDQVTVTVAKPKGLERLVETLKQMLETSRPKARTIQEILDDQTEGKSSSPPPKKN